MSIDSVIPAVLRTLMKREDCLRVPTLVSPQRGLLNFMSPVDIPWSIPNGSDPQILARMLELGLLDEVPENDLLPLCGHGLSLRQYWAAGTQGFRVSPKGRGLV